MTFSRVAALDDLWDGEMRSAVAEGTCVLLVHVGGEVSAFLDRCAHQGVRLSEGALEDGVIVCRAHGWRYDAKSGLGVNPKSACLKRFPLRIQSGEILVDVTGKGTGEP